METTNTVGSKNWKALVQAAAAQGIVGKCLKGCRTQGKFACNNAQIIAVAQAANIVITIFPTHTDTGYAHPVTGEVCDFTPIKF
jgi:hypothetical protein